MQRVRIRRRGPARDALVCQYRHLPRYVAAKLSAHVMFRRVGLEELAAAGMPALIRAAERWDERRGIKFITYAHRAILNLQNRVLADAGVLHVPSYVNDRREGDCREKAERVWRARGLVDDLQIPFRPEDDCLDREAWNRDELLRALATLPARDRRLVRLRYWRGMTLEQIGHQMRPRRTKERVRQIMAGILADLRVRMGIEPRSSS